jgi:hypothetical protein
MTGFLLGGAEHEHKGLPLTNTALADKASPPLADRDLALDF